MKKAILLLISILSISLCAQQEEYTAYLEQALEAAKNRDEKNFTTNLQYFSVAIERDNITPEILTKKNLDLYTEALFQAMSYAEFDLSDEDAKLALQFVNYDIENRPKNMFSLGRLYFFGQGVSQDYQKAFYWYEKAAKKGNVLAMNNLGLMYDEGYGVEKTIHNLYIGSKRL